MEIRSFDALMAALAPERGALLSHAIYTSVDTPGALRALMADHVFAVWDFMSLLTSLQRRLTCVTVPWVPPRSRVAARLINTIVLAEESDEITLEGPPEAAPISHFELYVEAMREVGADTRPIERLVAAVQRGASVPAALAQASAPEHVQRFVQTTFGFVDDPHDEVAASAFLVGREDLVPEMFRRLLPVITREHRAPALVRYLERHIEVDGDEHGPLARRLLGELCGDSPAAWQRATEAGRAALVARRTLWDGVLAFVAAHPPPGDRHAPGAAR